MKFYETYYSCEGKENLCKEKVEMYIIFDKTKAFFETFSESGFKFSKYLQFLVLILLLGEKMAVENFNRV